MSDENKLVTEQVTPISNDEDAVWDLVVRDMLARDAEGFRKYKTRLQRFNGRNALVDAYQESLDQTVYLRQAIEEKKEIIKVLEYYANPGRWGGNAQEAECDPRYALALLEKLGER